MVKLKSIISGLVCGSILTSIWLMIFCLSIQKTSYYGLAILPAIIISIVLFIIGFIVGYIIKNKSK